MANASRIGWCEGGWQVEDDGTLDATDLIFIGLVYHTMNPKLRRIDNPVGQLLRNQLRPTDLSYLLSEHDRQLQATQKAVVEQ